MANDLVPYNDLEKMAAAVSKSGLFGMRNADQAMALMLVAQAEGLHPMAAVQQFHIINGTPARKSWSILERFQRAGGSVEWKERTDTKVVGVFSHPQGGSVSVEWTPERAKKAQISNPMWSKYPRQMMTARVISEGVRTVFPGATGGFYTPEEQEDMVDVTPRRSTAKLGNGPALAATPPHDLVTGEVLDADFPPSDNIGPEPELPSQQPAQSEESARAEAYCNEAIKRIDECDSAEKIEAWFTKNKAQVERAKAANEEAYDALMAAAGYRKRKLLGEAA